MTVADEVDQLPYAPRMTEFTRPFWDAVGRGILTTTQCSDCGFLTFPPKPICPECWSENVQYIELSGSGALQSFTEVNIAPAAFRHEAPYVIAIIDLDEGVRLLSRIRAAFDDLVPDLRVRMVPRHAEPVSLFEFEVVPEKEAERA